MSRLILLLICMSIVAGSAHATTHLVNPDGSGDFFHIWHAVTSVAVGDTIELGDGTFTGDGNRDVDFSGKGLTIRSAGGDPTLCIIDVEGSMTTPHRGFIFSGVDDTTSVLEGVTVRNGYMADGGALYMGYADPTVNNCIFEYNTATGGGGAVWSGISSPTFNGCIFRENTAGGEGGAVSINGLEDATTFSDCEFLGNEAASEGGGFHAGPSVDVTLHDCLFEANIAVFYGGGAYTHYECTLDIAGCRFSGNDAWEGGGYYSKASWGPIADCRFEYNEATNGGGIYFDSAATSVITNTLFLGNTAVELGGGIYFHERGGIEPTNCTFVENSAPGRAAGSAIWGNTTEFSRINNCIIAFNGGGVPVETNTLLFCTDIYGNAGGDWVGQVAWQLPLQDNFSADPRFCGPEGPDEPYSLLDLSPCAPDYNPACGLVGAFPVGCIAISDVDPAPSSPNARLLSCYPNPFNPATAIRFELPTAQRVKLAVTALDGRLVAVLVDEMRPAGFHEIPWTGRDDRGRPAASGVYLCTLETEGGSEAVRLVLLK